MALIVVDSFSCYLLRRRLSTVFKLNLKCAVEYQFGIEIQDIYLLAAIKACADC